MTLTRLWNVHIWILRCIQYVKCLQILVNFAVVRENRKIFIGISWYYHDLTII